MLTFPAEELSRLQLSFKVGVPDGSFSFDVSPTSMADAIGPKAKSGVKVHFATVSDATGAVLKVWTSHVSCNDPSQIQSSSDVSGELALATFARKLTWIRPDGLRVNVTARHLGIKFVSILLLFRQ
jgi:hypothetical protein